MVVFIAVRQSVDMGVMDQRVVAISPGKLLGPEINKNHSSNNIKMLKLPDAEVVVGDELRRVVLRRVGENEGGDVAKDDDGAGH